MVNSVSSSVIFQTRLTGPLPLPCMHTHSHAGPLPHTLVDFWRLMWQERPPIIVMLTNLKENNKIKCQQYWPDNDSVTYGPFTVTITDQQVLANYTIRHLLLTVRTSCIQSIIYCLTVRTSFVYTVYDLLAEYTVSQSNTWKDTIYQD